MDLDKKEIISKDTSSKKRLHLTLILILIIFLPIWIFFIAPTTKYLPSDFQYSADLISIDNFYDEEQGAYTGDTRSVTKFSYNTISDKSGIIEVSNSFDVRTINGERVFSVERIYGIDKKTGKHVAGHGDKDRSGYLFAPSGLKKNESFTYWHINYDGPAKMEFVEEEVFFGLNTFKYESKYDGVNIDQTNELTFLPEVGITRGITVEPNLQIWIEPNTGHLVKYKDDTIAYYYDLETGEKLFPWNNFSNTFERSSIQDHVRIIKTIKNKHLIVDIIIPVLILLIVIFLIISKLDRKKTAVTVLLLGVLSMSIYYYQVGIVNKDTDLIQIGIANWNPGNSSIFDDNINGFKQGLTESGLIENVDVIYHIRDSKADESEHRKIAKEFKELDVDLIYALTTPGTLIIKSEVTDIPIVFSVVTYPVEAGVIESLKNSGNNLVGTRNWVPVKNQLSVFLELAPTVNKMAFMHRKGEPNSDIQFLEMKELTDAIGIELVDMGDINIENLVNNLKTTEGIDSIYSACDTLVGGGAEELIIEYAINNNIPTFSCNPSGPAKGDLLGVVADFFDIGKLAGEKAAAILNGVSPSTLETNTTSQPHTYINGLTAKKLNITIPQDILVNVKEIIR